MSQPASTSLSNYCFRHHARSCSLSTHACPIECKHVDCAQFNRQFQSTAPLMHAPSFISKIFPQVIELLQKRAARVANSEAGEALNTLKLITPTESNHILDNLLANSSQDDIASPSSPTTIDPIQFTIVPLLDEIIRNAPIYILHSQNAQMSAPQLFLVFTRPIHEDVCFTQKLVRNIPATFHLSPHTQPPTAHVFKRVLFECMVDDLVLATCELSSAGHTIQFNPLHPWLSTQYSTSISIRSPTKFELVPLNPLHTLHTSTDQTPPICIPYALTIPNYQNMSYPKREHIIYFFNNLFSIFGGTPLSLPSKFERTSLNACPLASTNKTLMFYTATDIPNITDFTPELERQFRQSNKTTFLFVPQLDKNALATLGHITKYIRDEDRLHEYNISTFNIRSWSSFVMDPRRPLYDADVNFKFDNAQVVYPLLSNSDQLVYAENNPHSAYIPIILKPNAFTHAGFSAFINQFTNAPQGNLFTAMPICFSMPFNYSDADIHYFYNSCHERVWGPSWVSYLKSGMALLLCFRVPQPCQTLACMNIIRQAALRARQDSNFIWSKNIIHSAEFEHELAHFQQWIQSRKEFSEFFNDLPTTTNSASVFRTLPPAQISMPKLLHSSKNETLQVQDSTNKRKIQWQLPDSNKKQQQ